MAGDRNKLKDEKQGFDYSIDFYHISVVDFRRSKSDCKKHPIHYEDLVHIWMISR